LQGVGKVPRRTLLEHGNEAAQGRRGILGIPVHVQAHGRRGLALDRADRAELHAVAQRRVGNRFRYQGNAEAAGHQPYQGVDLRGLLDDPGVEAGRLAQGDQLAVIAAAQRLWGEDEIRIGKIAQLDR